MDKRFVIDNSVVMAWCFADEISPYAESVLDSLEDMTAIVPAIWPLEVGNVLLVAERKKRLNEAASNRFITLLSQLPIIVDQEPPERMLREIFLLARENRLSTYDASYLDLALKRGLPIATLDDRLIAAAKQIQVRILGVNADL
ncbi:type II toxin-antitoxin system VapC family toxin [Desulfatirhabdium butyrativorans]|uniref:type II toxin-antitoxin system VapC family toxin n=1 Tax=Desulfatirhabdium butyrativorans TaxID=340467 RepID=UPI0004196088|nr:type II toxin-antitoxin system VapC family toxin [Desulfatirhabdium butyrativorans]